ncbi:MAG: flotillin family protein [Candidatus Wallbacteria bacterium]|nr:flotillin family protein [Candidatus Wallbacteria bacterium]
MSSTTGLVFPITFEQFLLLLLAIVILSGIRYIPNARIGIVEKRWSLSGSVKSGLMALRGEAGYQPDVLRGGLHYLMPVQYKVHILPLVTIAQGKVGYVFARDGTPLGPTQTLASNVRANNFESVAAFLSNGGQRGPQRQILREGTYALNLAQFVVITEEQGYYLRLNVEDDDVFGEMNRLIAERGGFTPIIIRGADDMIGVATVHDGPSLREGEIIAPVVGNDPRDPETYHNNFQDPERFLAALGRRGRQLQVLVDGTYFINRLFATVELIPKTLVEVGHVGIVVSYTGDKGDDLSGEDYKHGELVKRGQRGVWAEALLPGKYAFNAYAGKVILVPTTNIILKWIRNEVGSHHFDENLAEVSLITKDAFEPSLPLSVVVHIDYRKAPLVIQRFGDIKKLVEQTLDPMVSAYFKNIGQTRTLIQLLQDRSAIQKKASEEMKEKFGHYNLELEEVLIGTPTSSHGDKKIEDILCQLRARQIAEEQVETYNQQEKAAVKERELREAEARAKQQPQLTESELNITVQSNQGKAQYQRAVQQAAQVRALAEAEAEKAARVGIAQAIAIQEQVRAYGGPQFQLTQQVMSRFAEAIEASRVDVVPKIVIGGQGGNGSAGTSSVLEALLTMLLSEKLGQGIVGAATAANPEADRLRAEIQAKLAGDDGGGADGTAS